MSAPVAVLRELAGLFIDDGALALAILAIVACAGISGAVMPNGLVVGGIVLLVGCPGILLANVLSTIRRR
ncbi:MAG TPA: hypothetical protein VNF99_03315 [Stellaceae bacterium]|nr:hypothetical protein [Stellaceae bacterium]